jgi:glycine/D-amino acid oxidase-like deaminating enzyme
VTTAEGAVLADQVLICTNAYTDDLWPGLRQTVLPVRGYQIWSKPISENVRPHILRGISAMLDTRRLPTGLRLHPDGRLQFSGGPGIGREREPDLQAKVERVRALLPQLGPVEIDGWWSGWIAKGVADGWRMHRLADGVSAAIGCNGRGVAMGIVMGRELARAATGVAEADLIMPFTALRPQTGYAFHEPVARAMLQVYGWLDKREVKETRQHLEKAPAL